MDQTNTAKAIDLKAKIEDYEDDGGTVYYTLNMKCGQDKDTCQWMIRKRFSQFAQLHRYLSAKYTDLPVLPEKTLFKMTDKHDLETRMNSLNEYLQALCRKETMNSDGDFHDFIDLQENLKSKVHFNKERLLFQFPKLRLGITQFEVLEDQNIIIAACSEDGLQNKIATFWDKVTLSLIGAEEGEDNIGALIIFKIISYNPWTVEKLLEMNFKSLATCLYFDKTNNTLAVGFANGRIRIFEIPYNFKFIKDVTYESSEVRAHTSEVNGMCIDSTLGYIYSVSKDGNL